MAKEKLSKEVVRKGENDLLVLKVFRENKRTKLYLKVDKKIEELFQIEGTRESSYYKNDGNPLQFYEIGEPCEAVATLLEYDTKNRRIKIKEYGNPLVDSYGSMNFSILRSVGSSEGISVEIHRLISEEALIEWANELKEYIVRLYKNFVRTMELTVIIEKKEVF